VRGLCTIGIRYILWVSFIERGGVASVRGGGAPSTWQTEGQLLLRIGAM